MGTVYLSSSISCYTNSLLSYILIGRSLWLRVVALLLIGGMGVSVVEVVVIKGGMGGSLLLSSSPMGYTIRLYNYMRGVWGGRLLLTTTTRCNYA